MSEPQPRAPLYGGRGARPRIAATPLRSGMVSPATPFVNADDGTLTAVGFRFLFTLWDKLGLATTSVATLQRNVAQAAAVDVAIEDDVSGARAQLTALEARVAALEARLP